MQSAATSHAPSEGAIRRLIDTVGRALQGKPAVVEMAVTAVVAGGHLLVEDVPGVGKTTLARALAKSMSVSFGRIQCTSDLMPADVLGGTIYDAASKQFSFRRGPIFAQVLLADEINRTTPKTQSALLEAMEEQQVSVDGHTYPLERPFFVIATQNPQEFFGTYPLPESQLDRFLMRVRVGYPPVEVERSLLQQRRSTDAVQQVKAVATAKDILEAQSAATEVRVSDPVLDLLHDIVLQTRKSPLLSLGASTRGALALRRAAQARALVQGRDHLLPDDVKEMAVAVLAHRVRVAGDIEGGTSRSDCARIISDLVESLSVPL